MTLANIALLAAAAAILLQGRLILRRLKTMTQTIDDLGAAIGDLTVAITAENAEIDTLVDKLAGFTPGQDDDAIEDAVSKIKALTSGINDKLAQFQPADTSTGGQGNDTVDPTPPADGTAST